MLVSHKTKYTAQHSTAISGERMQHIPPWWRGCILCYEKQSSCRITLYGSYIGLNKAIKCRRRVFRYVLVGLLIKLRVIAWKVVYFWGCFASFQWYSLVIMFWGVFLIVLEYNFILKLMTYKNFLFLLMYVKSYLNRFFIKILKF